MTSVFGWCKDFLFVASVFLVISGFISQKNAATVFETRLSFRILEKTKILNHEAGEMHAIRRIQCFIKQ